MVAIRSEHLETLEAVIATALNIVRTRPLADLYVRRDYTGEFRIRVHPSPRCLRLAPQERNASQKTTAARTISSAAIVVTSAEVPGSSIYHSNESSELLP